MTLKTAWPKPVSPPPAKPRRVKRKNVKRAKETFERCYGSAERAAFVQRLPSVVSGTGPCENVHVRGGGASYKADAKWIVPMTKAEHAELHQIGKRTFEQKYALHLDELAEETDAAYHRWLSGGK